MEDGQDEDGRGDEVDRLRLGAVDEELPERHPGLAGVGVEGEREGPPVTARILASRSDVPGPGGTSRAVRQNLSEIPACPRVSVPKSPLLRSAARRRESERLRFTEPFSENRFVCGRVSTTTPSVPREPEDRERRRVVERDVDAAAEAPADRGVPGVVGVVRAVDPVVGDGDVDARTEDVARVEPGGDPPRRAVVAVPAVAGVPGEDADAAGDLDGQPPAGRLVEEPGEKARIDRSPVDLVLREGPRVVGAPPVVEALQLDARGDGPARVDERVAQAGVRLAPGLGHVVLAGDVEEDLLADRNEVRRGEDRPLRQPGVADRHEAEDVPLPALAVERGVGPALLHAVHPARLPALRLEASEEAEARPELPLSLALPPAHLDEGASHRTETAEVGDPLLSDAEPDPAARRSGRRPMRPRAKSGSGGRRPPAP